MTDPKILSWLAKRVGVSEIHAHLLWARACRSADRHFAEEERQTPAYWQYAVETFQRHLQSSRPVACPVCLIQAEQLSSAVDMQTQYLVNAMMVWKDMAVASSLAWRQACEEALAA